MNSPKPLEVVQEMKASRKKRKNQSKESEANRY